MTQESQQPDPRQNMEARADVEEYYPHYVNEEEVEFSHCYWECRCGWRSEDLRHPSFADGKQDGHLRFGRTKDCGIGKTVLVFEDGSVADV